jgi:hypothetical protein
VVRLLLDPSANINTKGGCHITALKTAEKNHHQAMNRLLLERGVTSSASDDNSCGSYDEDDNNNGDDNSGNMSREDWRLLKWLIARAAYSWDLSLVVELSICLFLV